jgi:hypothetical protein
MEFDKQMWSTAATHSEFQRRLARIGRHLVANDLQAQQTLVQPPGGKRGSTAVGCGASGRGGWPRQGGGDDLPLARQDGRCRTGADLL